MENAKQTIANFVARDGKHKTSVDEDVRPSITDEHIRPHRHENLMTALDKEIHQHHHHTVVQPVKHTETLPEKHIHHTIPVEHKTFHHGNDEELRDTLERDVAKYKSSSVTHETTHSSTTAPVVTGERVIHHVHEHVQPIVQKETIQPEVVHTTIPIHETHHAEAVHHGTSTLPIKTMDEWKREGGVLGGRAVHTLSDTAGCPAPYNKDFQAEQMNADKNMHPSLLEHRHHHGGAGVDGLASTTGTTRYSENIPSETSRAIPAETRRGENITSTTSRDTDGSSGRLGKTSPTSDKGAAHYSLGTGTGAAGTAGGVSTTASAPRSGTTSSGERQKPFVDSLGVRSGAQSHAKRHSSLADKLNPFKDADGDGKKGIMD